MPAVLAVDEIRPDDFRILTYEMAIVDEAEVLPLALTVNTPFADVDTVANGAADDSLTLCPDETVVAVPKIADAASTTVTADDDVVAEADTEAVPSTILSAEGDDTVEATEASAEASLTLDPFAVVFTSVCDVP